MGSPSGALAVGSAARGQELGFKLSGFGPKVHRLEALLGLSWQIVPAASAEISVH